MSDADERARLRALAEKAENVELAPWQRVHPLWELREALTPPVVLALLDAADQAEEAAALHYEARVDLQKAFDAERARAEAAEQQAAQYALACGTAVQDLHAERARAERLVAPLRETRDALLWHHDTGLGYTKDITGIRMKADERALRKGSAALADPAPAQEVKT